MNTKGKKVKLSRALLAILVKKVYSIPYISY